MSRSKPRAKFRPLYCRDCNHMEMGRLNKRTNKVEPQPSSELIRCFDGAVRCQDCHIRNARLAANKGTLTHKPFESLGSVMLMKG